MLAAGLLLALQGAPPAWLAQTMEQFDAACIARSLPTGAVPIAREEMPGTLRGHVRRASSGEYHRLGGGDQPSYLIQVVNPSRGMASACGVAVPNRRRLQTLFGAVMQLQSRATAAFGRDYSLEATIVGDWVVVQISHHAESQI
jgi:hypothetical protein